MNYITFDIETYHPEKKDDFDVNIFRVSVIGAYISWTNQYIAFFEEDVKEFLELLYATDLVVGFNHIWFDLPVLQKYTDRNLIKSLNNYDIMVEFEKKTGHKIKLDDLAFATLGYKKTDHYNNFMHYYHEGKMFELTDYCMHDVQLTEELFRMIQEGEEISYPDLLGKKTVLLNKPVKGIHSNISVSASMESIF